MNNNRQAIKYRKQLCINQTTLNHCTEFQIKLGQRRGRFKLQADSFLLRYYNTCKSIKPKHSDCGFNSHLKK